MIQNAKLHFNNYPPLSNPTTKNDFHLDSFKFFLKRHGKNFFIFSVSFFVMAIIIGILWSIAFHISFSPILLFAVFLFSITTFVLFFYQLFFRKDLLHIILKFYISQIIIFMISYGVLQIITGKTSVDYNKELLSFFLIFERFYILFLFVSLFIWKRKNSHFLPKTSFLTIVSPLIHSGICLCIVYFWIRSAILSFSNITLLVCLCYTIPTITDIVLLYIILNGASKQELFLQIKLAQRQMERNWNYYQSIQEQTTELHSLQKDFNQQLQQAYQIINQNSNDSKQALELLHELEKRINTTQPFYFCSDPIINTILEEYYRKTKSENISFSTHIEHIEDLFIERNDLYLIFSVSLSNAFFNACQGKGNRSICIFTYKKANFFIIKIIHSIPSNNKIIYKDKTHQKIFNTVIKKYHGNLEYDKTNDFAITLIFPFPEN